MTELDDHELLGCAGYFSFNGNLSTPASIRIALINDGKLTSKRVEVSQFEDSLGDSLNVLASASNNFLKG